MRPDEFIGCGNNEKVTPLGKAFYGLIIKFNVFDEFKTDNSVSGYLEGRIKEIPALIVNVALSPVV